MTQIAKELLDDLNHLYEARYRPVGMELCIFLESLEKQKFQVKAWFGHIDKARSGKLTHETQEQFVITLDTGEIIGRGFTGHGPRKASEATWRLWELEWNKDGRLKCRKCHNRWNPSSPGIPEQCPTCSGAGSSLSSIEAI